MAKKLVRGITDIKTINNQDFDTNNVNDLLSDGEHNYIHRKKKDNSEEYHNLTNNLKTIKSDNTDLLAVTNNNNTTNTATLHPKHDAQKEQVLESEHNTIDISHGANGSTDKTLVDVNASKVALLDNIHAGDNVSIAKNGNVLTIAATGGDKPLYSEYDLDRELYEVIKKMDGVSTTYIIYINTYKNEYTVEDAVLKADLVEALMGLKTYNTIFETKSGGITLSYDSAGSDDVKIITNKSSDNTIEQATFTFFLG